MVPRIDNSSTVHASQPEHSRAVHDRNVLLTRIVYIRTAGTWVAREDEHSWPHSQCRHLIGRGRPWFESHRFSERHAIEKFRVKRITASPGRRRVAEKDRDRPREPNDPSTAFQFLSFSGSRRLPASASTFLLFPWTAYRWFRVSDTFSKLSV